MSYQPAIVSPLLSVVEEYGEGCFVGKGPRVPDKTDLYSGNESSKSVTILH